MMKQPLQLTLAVSLFLAAGAGVGAQPPSRPAIHVNVVTLEVPPEAPDPESGRTLWAKEYELVSGENIVLSYFDPKGGQTYALDLTFSVPADNRSPSQEVGVAARWTPPGKEPKTQRLWIDGEMGVTIFHDPDTDRSVYLKIVPRVLWPTGPSKTAPQPVFYLRNAYLIVDDRVVGRDITVQAHELVLVDDTGEVGTISTTAPEPGAIFNGRVRGRTASLQVPGLRIEIIGEIALMGRASRPLYLVLRPHRAPASIHLDSLTLRAYENPGGQ